MMNPLNLIKQFYNPSSKRYHLLLDHSEKVAEKALDIASRVKHLNPDLTFIQEAAMLHDIGIYKTLATGIYCYGKHPYICHGYLGKKILDEMGLPEHGRVCETHVGTGLSVEEIKFQNLPLPLKDTLPISIEEKIICFADTFFSKKPDLSETEKSLEDVKQEISHYGERSLARFLEMCRVFEYE